MFDEQYYNDIWGHIGGVHRHDYTESLANRLISQYGKVRFLDIGTGCGHLVKVLRDKGAIAYGIDVSEYAVENSHGNVLLGDVRDIPFKDNSFDVVHSNGLWDYVPKEDVKKAYAECMRVGKIQDHNIDTILDQAEWTVDFATHESREWWDNEFKNTKRVLVTCPVYDGKAYSFDEWVKMAKGLTYPNYDILVVDNSKTEDFYNKYKEQIPMKHLDFTGQKDDGMYRVCRSMAEVQKHFLAGEYTHWMNIEADNIPPLNVIEKLMEYGKDADWIAHTYPAGNGVGFMAGIGCSLLSRRLIEDFDMSDVSIFDDSPDSELWNWVQKNGGYKTVELYYVMDVKHLK